MSMRTKTGPSAPTTGTKALPNAATLQSRVGELMLQLRQVHSAVVVVVAALRQQNCELDRDVANVLQRSVADRIADQVDRLQIALRPQLAGDAARSRRARAARARFSS